ncbi:hypothetical protein PR003_g32226 [Phytophthora rubi]|uniref:Uncharacterized protein n=1 Tax=Phytophthora rubi TaxID=129364 RepID=A0A6A4AYQ7_9STRA|nr:hypothetical protein PR003_g32226 [Phytophthora rubi]
MNWVQREEAQAVGRAAGGGTETVSVALRELDCDGPGQRGTD